LLIIHNVAVAQTYGNPIEIQIQITNLILWANWVKSGYFWYTCRPKRIVDGRSGEDRPCFQGLDSYSGAQNVVMDNIILSSGLAFIICFFSIPVIIQVAKDKKLYDEPDERKVHKNVIPTLGGLGIFAGFAMALLLGFPPSGTIELPYFMASFLVVFFLGLKDDILILSATKKFAGQIIAAFILVYFADIRIDNMHGFLGIQEIPTLASTILTVLTIVVIINSYNLIDGVDGLAGSLATLTSIAFGIYFAIIHQIGYAVMAFALAASLISFLIYNFSPAKIFMGDTGSLLVGLIQSILVIQFIKLCDSAAVPFRINGGPAIGFAALSIPLFDTLRVFGQRIFNRRSPFSPDRNHIHHYLLDAGCSHPRITLTLIGINLLTLGVAILLRDFGTNYLIATILFIGTTYTTFIYRYRQRVLLRNKARKAMQGSEAELLSSNRLFHLQPETADVD
jgi:UDP-N-acetylmuramyl pentapeptide phosphotransferase/UDP-N-acetylglucosamine-1-phosphate transferase